MKMMRPASLRLRFVRAFVVMLASLTLLGLALPGQAQAAAPARPAVAAASSVSSDSPDNCYDYSYNHGDYHYYAYCYDWTYRSESDFHGKRHWYDSYWLYYWYYDSSHHFRYGSCDYNYGSYSHSDRPFRSYCPGF
jgi:hypothetical protein